MLLARAATPQSPSVIMTNESLVRSIRAIGVFQYFVSFLFVLGSISLVFWGIHLHDWRLIFISNPFLMVLAIFSFLLARALRRFKSWARTVTIVICWIGLLGVPVGTMVGAAFLYVLIKGGHLFQKQPVSEAVEAH